MRKFNASDAYTDLRHTSTSTSVDIVFLGADENPRDPKLMKVTICIYGKGFLETFQYVFSSSRVSLFVV